LGVIYPIAVGIFLEQHVEHSLGVVFSTEVFVEDETDHKLRVIRLRAVRIRGYDLFEECQFLLCDPSGLSLFEQVAWARAFTSGHIPNESLLFGPIRAATREEKQQAEGKNEVMYAGSH
jgi:hypothetical protein